MFPLVYSVGFLSCVIPLVDSLHLSFLLSCIWFLYFSPFAFFFVSCSHLFSFSLSFPWLMFFAFPSFARLCFFSLVIPSRLGWLSPSFLFFVISFKFWLSPRSFLRPCFFPFLQVLSLYLSLCILFLYSSPSIISFILRLIPFFLYLSLVLPPCILLLYPSFVSQTFSLFSSNIHPPVLFFLYPFLTFLLQYSSSSIPLHVFLFLYLFSCIIPFVSPSVSLFQHPSSCIPFLIFLLVLLPWYCSLCIFLFHNSSCIVFLLVFFLYYPRFIPFPFSLFLSVFSLHSFPISLFLLTFPLYTFSFIFHSIFLFFILTPALNRPNPTWVGPPEGPVSHPSSPVIVC